MVVVAMNKSNSQKEIGIEDNDELSTDAESSMDSEVNNGENDNDNGNNDANDTDDDDNDNDDSEDEGDGDDDGKDNKGNIGWADSIAKVLKTSKPSKKNVLVLSRAAKSSTKSTEEPAKTYNFEIEGEEEKPNKEILNAAIDQFKKQKNSSLLLRAKPLTTDLERERALKKIATRGVVQLFNAVRIQQKDIQQQLKEAGPLDHKKDAVLNNINKRKFLDVLMSGQRSKSEMVDNPVKKEESELSDEDEEDHQKSKKKAEWSVLRDDFMTNKKLKNWDQDDSDSADGQANDSDDSD